LPVLTIGEHPDFLKWGGIIKLYQKDRRVVFDVNISAAQHAGINFRSKMLIIAVKVLGYNRQNK
jgi:hypothetical protein